MSYNQYIIFAECCICSHSSYLFFSHLPKTSHLKEAPPSLIAEHIKKIESKQQLRCSSCHSHKIQLA